MSQQKVEKDLGPYERRMLSLLKQRGQLKFGEIIMRLGLSANHGQRVLHSLMDKGLIERGRETNYFRRFQDGK
ncbi:MAG: MarR family transcriptional regulator [Bacteroidales bacterium]|nr:MarR family transcriptional regulator [Bacteroidales bacterium]